MNPNGSEKMTDEQRVKQVWPDAEMSLAHVLQKDGSRRRQWCGMSSLKYRKSRGKNRVSNIGAWCDSEAEAWASAASKLPPESEGEANVDPCEWNGKLLSKFHEFVNVPNSNYRRCIKCKKEYLGSISESPVSQASSGETNFPRIQPVTCRCGVLIFVRANGTIAPHWTMPDINGDQKLCVMNDKKWCDCHLHDKQVCDICQGVDPAASRPDES